MGREVGGRLTLTMHIGRYVQSLDIGFWDGFEPDCLPDTGTGRVEDVRGRVGLFTHYESQIRPRPLRC